jgi:hypothetical protein
MDDEEYINKITLLYQVGISNYFMRKIHGQTTLKCVTIITDMNAGVQQTTEAPCTCNIRYSVGSVQRNDTVEVRLLLHCFLGLLSLQVLVE